LFFVSWCQPFIKPVNCYPLIKIHADIFCNWIYNISVAAAPEQVSTIAEAAGIIQENSEPESTLSPPTQPESTSPSLSEPQLVLQIQQLHKRLQNIEEQLSMLNQQDRIKAIDGIQQSYKQKLSSFAPQEQELIKKNFPTVAPGLELAKYVNKTLLMEISRRI
jgi:hypothetical protein